MVLHTFFLIIPPELSQKDLKDSDAGASEKTLHRKNENVRVCMCGKMQGIFLNPVTYFELNVIVLWCGGHGFPFTKKINRKNDDVRVRMVGRWCVCM
jgi:hypothetical protein